MNGILSDARAVTPKLTTKATARLGATMDFFDHSDFCREDELDDLANMMDDHLNNALDGIWGFDDDCSIC